jgi:hypothetical protein
MSLGAIFIGAVEGKRPWSDVWSKATALAKQDVVDPVEAFGSQFLSDFGKAALAEAATVVPQILSGQLNIATAIPQIATMLEQQGIKIAETDALQEANTVIGNAVRVQVTSAQISSGS